MVPMGGRCPAQLQPRQSVRMRTAVCLLVVVVLLGSCGDDDEERAAAVTTSTTRCATDPTLPPAVDGTPAQLEETFGDVQIATVDHGASTNVVSLFVPVDCRLEAASIAGAPVALPIGGTVNHGDGLRCGKGDRFEVLTATSDDGKTYQATSRTYRLRGTVLTEVDRSASTIEAEADPDDLGAYYRISDC